METKTRTLLMAGRAAVAGGLLFSLAAVVQFRFGLFEHDDGVGYTAHQGVALTSVLLLVMALWWLGRARVAGDGRYARAVFEAFTAGWLLILLGGVLNLASGGGTGVLGDLGVALPAIGGGLNTVTGLLAGVAVMRARRLPGWARWSVLVYALYYFFVLSLPIVISGQEPTLATEVGWGLCWMGVGAAALTGAKAADDDRVDRAARSRNHPVS